MRDDARTDRSDNVSTDQPDQWVAERPLWADSGPLLCAPHERFDGACGCFLRRSDAAATRAVRSGSPRDRTSVCTPNM